MLTAAPPELWSWACLIGGFAGRFTYCFALAIAGDANALDLGSTPRAKVVSAITARPKPQGKPATEGLYWPAQCPVAPYGAESGHAAA